MLMGAVIGGALVYFLDPENGSRRRQQVRDWWEQNDIGERVNEASERVNEKVTELQSKVRDATG